MIQEDLYAAAEEDGLEIIFECSDVEVHDVTATTPHVTFTANGEQQRVDSDYVAGCDGQHGVSRTAIPEGMLSRHYVQCPLETPFEQRMREEDLNDLTRSAPARASLAEQYVGLDL